MTCDNRSRILVVLPAIPERRTGGGILLFEVLASLASRPAVARARRQRRATFGRSTMQATRRLSDGPSYRTMFGSTSIM